MAVEHVHRCRECDATFATLPDALRRAIERLGEALGDIKKSCVCEAPWCDHTADAMLAARSVLDAAKEDA